MDTKDVTHWTSEKSGLGGLESVGKFSLNDQNCQALFSVYAEKKGQVIDRKGIQFFFQDIKVSLEDPITIAICKLMEAQSNKWNYE